MGLCTKIDNDRFPHIQKDLTEMFYWAETEQLAESARAYLGIGIDDILITVNYEPYDEISRTKNIMGRPTCINFCVSVKSNFLFEPMYCACKIH